MELLPNEEKLTVLKAPQLFLTNQRVIEDYRSYSSVNLKDITIIRTVSYVNSSPAIIGIGLLIVSFLLMEYSDYAMAIGGLAFLIGGLLTWRSRRSTLDIHAPGGSISVSVNYVAKGTIREFIHKIEAEMERVKNGIKEPVMKDLAS